MGTIQPKTPIGVEVEAQSDELWLMAYLFLANWQVGVTLSQSFRTDVASSKTLSESRIGLVQRPYRTLTLSLIGLQNEDALRLEMIIARAAHAESMVPLYCDVTKLNAAYSSPSLTLVCDTASRRFKIGGKVVVAAPQSHKAAMPTFEIGTIAGITSSTLSISTGLVGDFPAGSKIYPVIEAKLALGSSVVAVNDKIATAQLSFVESTGNQALPELEVAGVNPTGFPTHDDGFGQGAIPVMDRQLQWFGSVNTGIARSGSFTNLGRETTLQTFGARGQFTRALQFRALSRVDAFDLIRFFESRAGQLHPFWIPSPFAEYDATAISAGSVDVTAVGPEFDWFFRPFIAIVLTNGDVHIREVASTARAAGIDTVTFDTPLPLAPTLADVRKVCMAHKVRFASDELGENWITDEVMDTQIPVIELLQEKDIDIPDLLTIPELAIPTADCTDDGCCCQVGGQCCGLATFGDLDCFSDAAFCDEFEMGPFFECCTDNQVTPCQDECGGDPFFADCVASITIANCDCVDDECQEEVDGCQYDAGPTNGCIGFECSPCP